MATLASLGTETLLDICKCFCVHCSDNSDRPLTFGTLQQHEYQREQRQGSQDPNAPSWYSLNRHALFALSFTCRRFYAVAQEILYHEFILGHGDSWKSNKYSWDRRLTSFMRTMSRRRDLAARVQRVSIHPLLLEPFDKPKGTKRPPRLMRAPAIGEARMALKRSAAALGVDLAAVWKPRWTEDQLRLVFPCEDFLSAFLNPNSKNRRRLKEALESSQRDQGHRVLVAEMVAMLIALLPNLQHLSLLEDGDHWPQLGFPNPAFTALGVSNLPLKILDTELPRRMVPVLATGLEELNIHHCQQFYGCPKMPALKILRASYVDINKDYFDTLMSCCTGSLHTFVYETNVPLGSDERFDQNINDHAKPKPKDIIEHLEARHIETLQTLHIDMRVSYFDAGGSEQVNIRHFTALRHVLLSSNMVFGRQGDENDEERSTCLAKILPENIETLCLVCPSPQQHTTSIEAGLIRLANLKQSHPDRFPNLKSISVALWGWDHGADVGGSRCEFRFREVAEE
ncbi:hypothetical protein N0V84_005281 [Fusarium piperis]|uniref:Uncharacterized protein n=1 Tax=Fusarium piperis TaxID=1435070 RepID=A0A9W8WDW8_9HYPO|nr:hypothetical protein N0V84_005281 [Fusarium piperis]